MSPRFVTLAVLSLLIIISDSKAQQAGSARLQRYAQEGEKALAERRYDDAASAYEKVCGLAPNMAEAHARLGLIYFQMGRFEQAVKSLRQALRLKPSLPNTGVMLGMALSETGAWREALPLLENGYKRAADPVLKRASGLQLQRAYTGLGQDDKAVEVALELSRLYPRDPEVLYHAGRIFGNYAYLSTVRLAEAAPGSLWLHLAAGEANESQGRTEAAIQDYRQVLAIHPDRQGVHYRIGRTLLARARQSTEDTTSEPEALKEFELELRIDPTNANAAYEAGEIHRKMAQFDQALKLFSQAVEHYPDFEEALVAQGRTLLSLGRAQEALDPLRKSISLNNENEVAWFQLAQAYRTTGNAADQQKALSEFQRLRELNTRRAENGKVKRSEVTRQALDPKGLKYD